MKNCICCYLLDAYVGGEVVRKRKYRRESGALSTTWYDYDNKEITDSQEISRLNTGAIPENECDCVYYRDHVEFMKGMNIVDSITNLPATKNHILVNWNPAGDKSDTGSTTMSFKNKDVFDGDSFYVIVHNVSDSNVDLYAPSGEKDVNIWGNKIEMEPNSYCSVKVLYDKGIWYWELISIKKGGSGTEDEVDIDNADILVVRFYWTDENGSDLNTATELTNSNIPWADNKAVGWSCPGNSNEAVTSIIHWAGDNTYSGNECVYIDMKKAIEQYGDILPEVLNIAIYGTWYYYKGTGGAEIEISAYKGGTMRQDGYNFINEGGELKYNNKHAVSVDSYKGVEDYRNKYTYIADVKFDKNTGSIKVKIK